MTAVVSLEEFDERSIATLPRGSTKRQDVLDITNMVGYEGLIKMQDGLFALAISRLGSKLAQLKTVPEGELVFNNKRDKVYLKTPMIGSIPSINKSLKKGGTVTLEQRSLTVLTDEKSWHSLPTGRSERDDQDVHIQETRRNEVFTKQVHRRQIK